MDTTCPKCQQEIEGTRKGGMTIYTCQPCVDSERKDFEDYVNRLLAVGNALRKRITPAGGRIWTCTTKK